MEKTQHNINDLWLELKMAYSNLVDYSQGRQYEIHDINFAYDILEYFNESFPSYSPDKITIPRYFISKTERGNKKPNEHTQHNKIWLLYLERINKLKNAN